MPIIHYVSTTQQALELPGITLLAGLLVELDYSIDAGSFSFWIVTHLEKRPPAYRLTFATPIGDCIFLVSRDLHMGRTAFATLASHLLRDVAVGTAPVVRAAQSAAAVQVAVLRREVSRAGSRQNSP